MILSLPQPTRSSSTAFAAYAGLAALFLFAVGACREEGAAPSKPVETTVESGMLATGGATAALAGGGSPREEAGESSFSERQVFFGDLHVHSSWSLDAFAAGVNVGPVNAYRYARGESIPHASGHEIKLAGPPLDFIALTDHAEYLGLTIAASDPTHPVQAQPLIRSWMGENAVKRKRAWKRIMQTYSDREVLPALVTDAIVVPAWRSLIEIANQEYLPGQFTSFVGFEYSPNPDGQNLHRNVIFRGDRGPDRPFSAMDSANPEDLWNWMDEVRDSVGDLLAIPHNANGSNGLMFATTRHDGTEIDAAWIEQRARNEPVAEVFQIKGQSETHPALSPTDEWAGFEIFDQRTTRPSLSSQPAGSYIRDALKRGLAIEARAGRNPYALGMIGSTDGHNASSPFEERNYTGKIGTSDATPEQRLSWIVLQDPNSDPLIATSTRWGAAGLAGIWAEENSREALFDALRRRETFATSGPRIRVRIFAGWDFAPEEAGRDLAQVGYSRGVAMGGVLTRSEVTDLDTGAPTFLFAASKDPIEADLERVQIVKGWLSAGQTHERVFDVACAKGAGPDPKNHHCTLRASEPDLKTCTPALDAGSSELSGWWRDPEYDPEAATFYYARVIQIPTCRWSTFDANRLGIPLHDGVPATLQERAVTSPIWIGASAE